MVDLHPDVAELAPLLGTWEGGGVGHYPTIEDFAYFEQVVIDHDGQPFLRYEQRTREPVESDSLHTEVGYLRVPEPGGVELVVAHATGIVEIQEGTWDGEQLRVSSNGIGRTSTAKAVRSVRREFVVEGDRLSYDVWMAYADVAETHHVSAKLHRAAEPEEQS